MDLERKIHKSQFVPKGNWGNSLSPLTHVGFGSNGFEPDETTHSSFWLWKTENFDQLKPRFCMGFPEEFHSFQTQKQSDEFLKKINLDMWVFRDLSESEFEELSQYLTANSGWKIIFIRNQMNDYEKFFSHPVVNRAIKTGQAFLSFLPPVNAHDTLLTPQQVIWNLDSVKKEIPILILDVPTSQNTFYNSLDRKILAEELASKNSLTIKTFKIFDRLGLSNLLLFGEAFFGFFLSYRMQRLFNAIAHFFNLRPWFEMAKRMYIVTWHKFTKPLLVNIFYVLFYRPIDLIFNLIIKNVVIFTWHKFIWPTLSLGYVVIKKISGIFPMLWGKVLLPMIQFFYYKILISVPLYCWIFIRHKIFQPIYSFLRFTIAIKIWIFFRYHLVGILLMLSYPLRKLYWIAKHEYEKRIKYRGRYEKS